MLISPVNCATIVKMNSFKCRLVICAFLLSVGFVLCLSSPSFPVLNSPSVSREDLQLGTSVDLQHTAYEWEPYIRLEQYHDQVSCFPTLKYERNLVFGCFFLFSSQNQVLNMIIEMNRVI